MPIYEYRCNRCRRMASLYQRTFSSPVPPCPHCGEGELKRIFSTFSVRGTPRDVYEGILSDGKLIRGMMRNDPRALADWNKRMSGGEPVAPEYQEMVGKMERGERAEGPVTEAEKGSAAEKGSDSAGS